MEDVLLIPVTRAISERKRAQILLLVDCMNEKREVLGMKII